MKRIVISITAFALIFATYAFAGEMTKTATLKGWVTDTECAAHGVKNCSNKQHVEQGARLALVSDADSKVWVVENPEKLANHQGHHVKVKGTTNLEAGTIRVQRVLMLKEKKMSEEKKMEEKK